MIALNNHPSGRHFLQIPGPSPVPDRILRAISLPTRNASPCAIASTVPSGQLRTQPVTLSCSARSRIDSRKKTP